MGNFIMVDPLGRLTRRREDEVAPFAYIGLQILHPRLFRAAQDGAFSLNRLYDQAAEAGRLWGIVHDGEWFHISTPADLAEAQERLSSRFSYYHRI